jgi:hypothetical protein
MRRVVRGLVIVAAVAAAGCFGPGHGTRHVAERVPELTSAPADRVILDYRLVDQPAGDPFAADSLWTMARCPLPHDQAALLAENGFRVGVVTGLIPTEFLARVTNERYLIDPRALATAAGEEKIIPVNGPLESVTATVRPAWSEPTRTSEWAALECGLAVSGVPGSSGRFRLTIGPTIQSGTKQSWLRPTGDNTRFVWDQQKTRESFAGMTCEVELGANEYVVIGPTDRPTGTLGERFFFVSEPARARQRFLVIRGRAENGTAR